MKKLNKDNIIKLDEWIISSKTGASSKTLWAVFKGVKIDKRYGSPPFDLGDFGRCYLLVKDCGISKEYLMQVPIVLPYWKPYIDNWGILSNMYEEYIKVKENKGYYSFFDSMLLFDKMNLEMYKIRRN